MEYTKGEDIETRILHAIDEVLKFSDPNTIKASIILNRIRTILGLKDLNAAPELYEACKAFQTAMAIWQQDPSKAPITLTTIFNETIGQALAKAGGK